jgi:hypothetical protein
VHRTWGGAPVGGPEMCSTGGAHVCSTRISIKKTAHEPHEATR